MSYESWNLAFLNSPWTTFLQLGLWDIIGGSIIGERDEFRTEKEKQNNFLNLISRSSVLDEWMSHKDFLSTSLILTFIIRPLSLRLPFLASVISPLKISPFYFYSSSFPPWAAHPSLQTLEFSIRQHLLRRESIFLSFLAEGYTFELIGTCGV